MKVAINGFGRIGRLAFRKMCDRDDMELVALNSRSNINMLAHLLKYDSTQGRFQKKVEIKDDKFIIDDKKEVKVFAKSDPSELPWGELGIDVVLECTGAFTDREKASIHIKSGAKKVLISSPAKKDDIKMVVYNVNHDILDGTEDIISGASCTTNCLAPMAKALNNSFGIERGLMTTIHAYTADQNTLDASHRKNDKRRARSAGINIVPNTTGAARAIGQVIPELKGKLDGASMRVPVATGSITELTSVLKKKVTVEEVNEAMKKAANESFGYNEDEIVSSDIVGMEYGSLFDATLTKIVETQEGQLVKTVAWYDNEMSYTCQLIKTLAYIGKLMKK